MSRFRRLAAEKLESRQLLATDVLAELQTHIPLSSSPHRFTALHDRVYFQTSDGIWSSDGTVDGTVPLGVVPHASRIAAVVDDALLVETADGQTWRTDGMDAGTFPLSLDARRQRLLQVAGGIAYFVTEFYVEKNVTYPHAVVAANTESGEVNIVHLNSVRDLATTQAVSVATLENHRRQMYVHRIDGLDESTRLHDESFDYVTNMEVYDDGSGSRVYFLGSRVREGRVSMALYRADGEKLEIIHEFPEWESHTFGDAPLEIVNGNHYFTDFNLDTLEFELKRVDLRTSRLHSVTLQGANCRCQVYGHGDQTLLLSSDTLWRYDPDSQTATQLAQTKARFSTRLQIHGEFAYFNDKIHWWRTDGTPEGTQRLQATSILPADFAVLDDQFFFQRRDELHGAELWTIDEGDSDSKLLKDIRPASRPEGVEITNPMAAGDEVYFQLDGEPNQLWFVNPREDHPQLVNRLNLILDNPELVISPMKTSGPFLYFAVRPADELANSGITSLWATDGTVAGTQNLLTTTADITPLSASAELGVFTFFTTGTDGEQRLWRSAGTPKSTFALTSGGVHFLSEGKTFGDRLAFYAEDPIHGTELWATDFSRDGTQIVSDFAAAEPAIGEMHESAGKLYFVAEDGDFDLYVTSGTPNSTRPLMNFVDQSDANNLGNFLRDFVTIGDTTYFIGFQTPVIRSNIWRTQGTAETTRIVEATARVATRKLIAVDETLVFQDSNKAVWFWHPGDDSPRRISRGGFNDVLIAKSGSIAVVQLSSDTSSELLRIIGTETRPSRSVTAFRMRTILRQEFVPLGDRVLVFDDTMIYSIRREGDYRGIELAEDGEAIQQIAQVDDGAVILTRFGSTSRIYFTDGTDRGTYLLEEFHSKSSSRKPASIVRSDRVYYHGRSGFPHASLWSVLVESRGDVNHDKQLDARDIDAVFSALSSADSDPTFDINEDGEIDETDVTALVEIHLQTHPGDAHLDHRIDFNDYLVLSTNYGREGLGWSGGDFDGDGVVGFKDFLLLSSNFPFFRFDSPV